MWGNFKQFCCFQSKSPRVHVKLHCNANDKIKLTTKRVLPSHGAGMLLFRVDGANRCRSDMELIALINLQSMYVLWFSRSKAQSLNWPKTKCLSYGLKLEDPGKETKTERLPVQSRSIYILSDMVSVANICKHERMRREIQFLSNNLKANISYLKSSKN